MQPDQAISAHAARHGLHNNATALLQGRLLTVARGAWLIIVTLSVGLFLAAVPLYYRSLLQACAGAGCGWQLSAPEHLALQALGLSPGHYAAVATISAVVLTLCYVSIAVVIFLRRSREGIALLTSLWLVTFVTAETGMVLVEHAPVAGPLIAALDVLGWVILPPLFLLTFPDGHFVPRWTRWLFASYFLVGFAGEMLERIMDLDSTWGQVLWISMHVTAVAAQVYRTLRVSTPVQRQQTKWFVSGLVVAVFMLGSTAFIDFSTWSTTHPGLPGLLDKLAEMTLVRIAFLIIPLALGISILRHRLWDIDLIISRTLIWGLLSAIVVGLYALVVGAFGALFQSRGAFLPSVLATGLIALLFHPLRRRVQRGVNRLMYGERDEPYAVLSRLGSRLEATLAPGALLPTIVETVAQALRLPYVAITLKQDGDFQVAASSGKVTPQPLVLPLSYRGEIIGQLRCGLRSGGPPFNAQEQRLLQDIARQAGVALHAQRLAADVQRARERLVIAREEERRRIRRDLHDGLGPALASQTLKLGSARALLQQDPAAAAILLQQLETESAAALKDIRRLVYNLRPPALDELGLLRALEQSAPHRPGLDIAFSLPPSLPQLSAAAEVAVYRIVQEALANVVRHAQASNAGVRVESNGELVLTITDDGKGLPPDVRAGVGLNSMRERAEELGGAFDIISVPGSGATIEVHLPLRGEET